jgi:pimeloyl-ACP methyl ester carboxylesterase
VPTVDRDGVRIHYELDGDGPPLVLHTGTAGDLRMWRHAGYATGLAGHRLLLIDPRGHGLSGRPRGLAAHRIERYVDDVAAVLDAEEIERAAFFGYSDGAGVGYQLAADHPGRVRALVAMGALEHPDQRPALARACRVAGMAELARTIQADEILELPAWLWLQLIETDTEMLCLELEAWADWSGPWPLLPRIEAPALVIVGEHEDPSGEAARAAVLLPYGRAVTVPDVGHMGVFLAAESVLAAAAPFLTA